MSRRVSIALRWSVALGLLGWGLVRTMIVPFGSTFFVLVGAVVSGPYLVGSTQARLRIVPGDVSVLRRRVKAVVSVLAAILSVLVMGLALEAGGARPAGALLVGAGLAATCAVMAVEVCRLWRGHDAPSA